MRWTKSLNLNKERIISTQEDILYDDKGLLKDYKNSLDSIDIVFSIKTLKTQVAYLLSQDPKYSKSKEKEPQKKEDQDNNMNAIQSLFRLGTKGKKVLQIMKLHKF